MSVSNDCRLIAMMGQEHMSVWDTANYRVLLNYMLPRGDSVTPVVMLPDGRSFAYGQKDGIRFATLREPSMAAAIAPHTGKILEMQLSTDGQSLICLGALSNSPFSAAECTVWPVHQPERLSPVYQIEIRSPGNEALKPSLALSPDGKQITLTAETQLKDGHSEYKIVTWNPPAGEFDARMTAPAYLQTMKYAKDGSLWMLSKNTVRQWQLESTVSLGKRDDPVVALASHRNWYDKIIFHDNFAVVSDVEGRLSLFDAGQPKRLPLLSKHVSAASVTGIAGLTGGAGRLVAGDALGNLFILEGNTLNKLSACESAHRGAVTAIAAFDDVFFISGGRDGVVRFWALKDGGPEPLFQVKLAMPVKQLILAPNHKTLYVLCDDERRVRRIDLAGLFAAFQEYGLGLGPILD